MQMNEQGSSKIVKYGQKLKILAIGQTVILFCRSKTNSTSAISSFMQKYPICSSKIGFLERQSILKFLRLASTAFDDEDDEETMISLILANF